MVRRISPSTLRKIKSTILDCCDSLSEYKELVALFSDARIRPWRDMITRASQRLIQAEMLISDLGEQYRSDTGENVLVLFLVVLAERYEAETACFQRLQNIVTEIDNDLIKPQEKLPSGITKEYIGRRLESLRQKDNPNYLDKRFLDQALDAAKTVCRLEWHKRGVGTGFLVSDDLVLTCFHVIQNNKLSNIHSRLAQCEMRFGVTQGADGSISAGSLITKLASNPVVEYSEIKDLDFALLRLIEPLPALASKVKFNLKEIVPDQHANIIHYPLGGPQKISIRNNEIIQVDGNRIYYVSDTEEGSSGSPIYNDEWEVIGIHRSGALFDEKNNIVLEGNQGILLSAFIDKLKLHIRF